MIYQVNSSVGGNAGLNPQGSGYATDFNKGVSTLVAKAANKMIFDAAPQQFFLLKMLNMQNAEFAPSDEFFFQEMGYQREPITVVTATSQTSYPNSVVVTVNSLDHVSTDTLIGTPDNNMGSVVSTNPGANQITIKPQNDGLIEALAVDDELFVTSTIEADGTDEFAQYFRAQTVERSNYVQLFAKAIKYGEVEKHKMIHTGINNFLSMEKKAMYRQFRIDIENALWNGHKGEVTLSNGDVAKTTGGIYDNMIDAGSTVVDTPLASITEAFEQLALDTEYGDYGATRFFFAPNDMILKISKAYKDDKTRYSPNDSVARLGLSSVNIGSSNIVLVPNARFKDGASFPASWATQGFLLDLNNIKMCQMWNERQGDTSDNRATGQGRKRSSESWIDANMGLKFFNPLACGILRLA